MTVNGGVLVTVYAAMSRLVVIIQLLGQAPAGLRLHRKHRPGGPWGIKPKWGT
jgi:hypothetical protein